MELFAGFFFFFFADLLSLFGADVQCVLVSVMGSVKAGLHMSPYRYNLEEEVMSWGQLALICAAALCEKYRAKTGGWSQNSHLAAAVFFSFGFVDTQ